MVAVGTAASVVSIRSITNNKARETFKYLEDAMTQGPYAYMLSTALDNIMRCKAEDTFGWCHKLGEPRFELQERLHRPQLSDRSRRDHANGTGIRSKTVSSFVLPGSRSGVRHSCN